MFLGWPDEEEEAIGRIVWWSKWRDSRVLKDWDWRKRRWSSIARLISLSLSLLRRMRSWDWDGFKWLLRSVFSSINSSRARSTSFGLSAINVGPAVLQPDAWIESSNSDESDRVYSQTQLKLTVLMGRTFICFDSGSVLDHGLFPGLIFWLERYMDWVWAYISSDLRIRI